jgi:hypothetical protein
MRQCRERGGGGGKTEKCSTRKWHDVTPLKLLSPP